MRFPTGLGVILGPEDREAMDGLFLLLFTVVPIRLFCWVMAAVFVGFGGAWSPPEVVAGCRAPSLD